jgi:N-acyl-D-aspartate/D-glutamate deacylase
MPTHDLLIRGGTVVDGSGGPPYAADVAVTDGLITDVGKVEGSANRTVDADGALVTPGFVDVHCHYDGQATWDSQIVPSAWHGVTTVVMGNCGVGFAPVREADHQRLIELMIGLHDRGLVAEGMKANLNVIDLDGLTLHRPTMAFDLPAGGKRLLQRADGYLHTFVSGQEVYAEGEHTGALPGRLVRGAP